MNILVLTTTLPSPTAGASNRNYQLLKILSSQHNITLLSFQPRNIPSTPELVSNLQSIDINVQLISQETESALIKRWKQVVGLLRGRPAIFTSYLRQTMQHAINRNCAMQHYDVVLYESVLIAEYRLPRSIAVIIDQHNLEFEIRLRTFQQEKRLARKWYNWFEGHLLKRIEIERCRRANALLVTSERERIVLQELLPASTIHVVPNGVDTVVFRPFPTAQEVPNRVVFTGAMDYYPNVNAACHFARHCWPHIKANIPDATWQIVGKHPQPEVVKLAFLPGVEVTGTVPDTRPYLASASVAIAPLYIGSGTRLKILEAFAMQKAVVSTHLGCEGLTVDTNRHLLIEDEPAAFAEAVIHLLRQQQHRRELGEAGRALVELIYSWDRCGQPLISLLHDLEQSRDERNEQKKTLYRLV